MQLTMSKEQAAYFMWKHSQASGAKRYEISKAGSLSYLINLLDRVRPHCPSLITPTSPN